MERLAGNPLITAADVKPTCDEMEVFCVFNPGAVRHNGQTILLVRVAERPKPEPGFVSTAILDCRQEPPRIVVVRIPADDPDLDCYDPRVFRYKGQVMLTSISHLRVARSRDGEHFQIDNNPAMVPQEPLEAYGIEDPRITRLNGRYWINYSAVSHYGVCTALASTVDFVTFERHGTLFAPDNKDIAIFPATVNGRYVCRHRPSQKEIGIPTIWTAFSDNLLDWGGHRPTMSPRPGMWDCERVGCGAPPVQTGKGWIDFYHGANHETRYCVGAMLTALDQPWRVLARTEQPILEPTAPYERQGLVPNVCFHNGLVADESNVTLYYGGADSVVCGARISLDEVFAALRPV